MGPELIVVVAASVLAVGAVVALVLRGERSRRRQVDAELAVARRHVDALEQRLDQVSEEIAEAKRGSVLDRAAEREYVITTIGEVDLTDAPAAEAARLVPPLPPSAGRLLEERLVEALSRQREGSRLRSSTAKVAVKMAAASHGVRRAIRPEVRDRAAAEAYVARRQSRRARRQELREARRLLRVVRSREASPASDEDAA